MGKRDNFNEAGEQVRNLRKKLNMSVDQAARVCSVDSGDVLSCETGSHQSKWVYSQISVRLRQHARQINRAEGGDQMPRTGRRTTDGGRRPKVSSPGRRRGRYAPRRPGAQRPRRGRD